MRRITLFCALLTACLSTPLLSHAQFGGQGGGGQGGGGGFGGGGGSGFGGGGGGSGLGGGGGFGGGGGLGGQGGGGFGGGGGLGGQGGGGFGGAGGGGFGQGGANMGQNGMGAQQGQAFLGRNTNQNQFLGRNTPGQGLLGNMNQNGGGNRRGNANRGANNPNGMNNQQQIGMGGGFGGGAAKQAPVIRPRQKIAFDHPAPHLPAVSGKLETRLNKMTSLSSPNLNLSVNPSGELVMKGEVASARDAKLAENMARMEPGVRKIRNELTFPGSTSTE